MTPFEKAIELVDEFLIIVPYNYEVIDNEGNLNTDYNAFQLAKLCAHVVIDYQIKMHSKLMLDGHFKNDLRGYDIRVELEQVRDAIIEL
jgi:hypothetical protein